MNKPALYDFNQRVHLRADPDQWGYTGHGDTETQKQDVFWEHAGADIVTCECVADLMDETEYRERRRLFFATMRRPEMRWVREAFKHLKHDQGIDWRTIQSIEFDPPWEIDGFSKQSWIMTTDTFVTMLLDPSRYDGIEDFSTYLFHDANNAYCECIWCYDATIAKRRAENEVSSHE